MMAKIKIKNGENEIEIDSRDFYVDNKTLGDVIQSISKYIPENTAKIVYEPQDEPETPPETNYDSLNSLPNAEAFEPEFSEPKPISFNEVKEKLRILEADSFFDYPRTVTETVEQLRELGWAASPLDVSKTLSNMVINREITKNSEQSRICYST